MNIQDVFHHPRYYSKHFAVAVLLLLALPSWAQVYTPRPVPVATPHYFYGNNSSYKPRIPKTEVEKSSKVHEYTIHFTDSTTLHITGRVNESNGKYYLSVNSGTRAITPKETTLLVMKKEDGEQVPGIPFDGYWQFEIFSADIKVFSELPEDDLGFIIGIQKGDEPIQPLTKANLQARIKPSVEVQKLLNKWEVVRALEKYMKESRKTK